MAAIIDLTSQLSSPTAFTGSIYPQADSAGVQVTAPLQPNPSYSTGSWPGLGNTWGASTLLTASLTVTESLGSGHWWGIDVSWGTYMIVTESFDREDTVSNMFPFTDQGLADGDWDPFPIPPPPPTPELPQRDTTRYRKSYSSQRHQPKRIRLIKG